MAKLKTIRKDVLTYLAELKAAGKYDNFKVYDDIRERFKLTRTQTADIIQEFRESN